MDSGLDEAVDWVTRLQLRLQSPEIAPSRRCDLTSLSSLTFRLPVLGWAGFRSSQSQSHIATDGKSVSLGVDTLLGLMTRDLLLFDSYVFVGALSVICPC
jgi:hypothetical protein